MNNRLPQSLAVRLTVLGLLLAAAGIATLFLSASVAVPAVPIGPILLLLVAGLVAFGPWRWTPIAAILVALFVLGGAFIAPGLFSRLSNPAQAAAFIGTWVQVLGLLLTIGAAAGAIMQQNQNRSATISR